MLLPLQVSNVSLRASTGGRSPLVRFHCFFFVDDALISAGTIHMPWWAGKEEVRDYLRKVNEDKKVRLSVHIATACMLTVIKDPRVYPLPTRPILGLPRVALQDREAR